ncbi:restriction endonuclease subunit S [Phocaeicola vulgatus]|uniref:restriction endonuclease subunit S n=1 Tax=Phocaeicola vulgatus TaxID=821 RepID=UPI00293F4559|nr:restriction endonuclease subunit S [Phocaeicola vulgatus]
MELLYISLCTNQSIAAILPNDKYDSLYLYYVVDSKYDYLRLLSSGDGGRGGLNKNLLNSLEIVFPKTIAEQRAIAEALSDIDGLIAALDKKIAKKRLIKQGAMQQLLTGKKRLPGFTDSWVEKKLGEILDYEQPQPYLVVSTDYVDSGIPVLTAGKSRILGYTTEQFGIYNKLPVIIFDDFTTDSKYISYPFKVKSSAMKVLSLKNNDYDLRLVYELMQQIDFPLKDHQRYWISEYSQLTISIPKDREEQTAIATILTDMDKEIADLEAKRDKYSLLKSGMMQKLLTGQIRLKINRI